MYKLQLIFFCLLSYCYSIGQIPDADNDGVPNMEDVCPGVAGPKSNKGCPENISDKIIPLKDELSAEDKKMLITNFQKVLQQIPSKFEKLKTGEEDWDIINRISWYKSNLQLFPNHTDKSKTQLMYGMYSGKPVIAFIENASVDVNTIVQILAPVLKAKGMIEVNTKFVIDDPAARSFRSKDAVLQINSGSSASSAVLNIGKLPYYYETDVRPISAVKPKPAVVVQAKNEIVELKQAILKANEAVKKNKSNPFIGFATTKAGKNNLYESAKESVWQVKNAYSTVVTSDNDEICIQASSSSGEQLAKLYSNPCMQLGSELGPGYKVIYDNGDSYMARFENVSITYAVMQCPDYQFAPFIFIRPSKPQTESGNEEKTVVDKPADYITLAAFEDIMKTICQNSVHLKIKDKVKPVDTKIYETTFPKNGYKRNIPVYYSQANKYRFTTTIGLSDNVNDLGKAAAYINSLLEKTNACMEAYRTFKLEFNATTGKYADVSAWDDGGMFVYVEKENGLVQLRINKINYTEEEKQKNSKPAPVVNNNTCADIETILNECLNGYKNRKGSFVKKETPASYYNTTLPSLGFEKIFVVESMNIEIQNGELNRKPVIYYSADQAYTSTGDAIKMYDKVKEGLKKCFSGTANITDDKNQKIYELFTYYSGKKIRITLIYLNFFSSSVSVSIKLAD